MANIAGVLKAEISRISRKEVRLTVKEIAKSNTSLKKTVSALKKRVALLEKENKRLMAAEKKQRAAHPRIPAEETKKARITSRGIRSLRSRLGLTRPDFAKLCGTTAQTVYMWEKKEGTLNLRGNTKGALLSIRGLGAKEAKKRLAGTEVKREVGGPVPPRRKRSRQTSR
jgi:DNA-binding transcriptional regulator YiaG